MEQSCQLKVCETELMSGTVSEANCRPVLGFRFGRRCVLLLGCLLVLSGCGSETIDTSVIKKNWQEYTTEHFRFYFPDDSPRARRMPFFSAECEEIFGHVIGVLGVQPEQAIDFFLFTTEAQGDSLIGRSCGFFAEGQIFLCIGQHPGGSIALAGCYLIDPQAASFDLLKTGMYELYSRVAVNIHAETFAFERKNRFIPLVELTDNTLLHDRVVYQTEAASFCAFLLTRYGADRFRALWRAERGLAESIEQVYQLKPEVFEKQWQEFYRRESTRT